VYISAITETIQCRLCNYLQHLQYLIHRNSSDKLSIISADVILMSYEHFTINCDQVSDMSYEHFTINCDQVSEMSYEHFTINCDLVSELAGYSRCY